MKEVEIMKIKLNPFEENIRKYNRYEIADWLHRCRNLLSVENNLTSDFKELCDNWNTFRENNKDFFESETFKQGMLMSAIKRPKIIIKTKKEKIDISDDFYAENMGYMVNFPSKSVKDFIAVLKKCVVQSMDEYLTIVENMFDNEPDAKPECDDENERRIIKNYKQKIANAIKYVSAEDIFELRFDELSENLKDTSSYSQSELIKELNKYKTYVPKKRQTSINKRLEERDISKSVYFDWLYCDTEEREFGKKFFVNLAFYLSLPSDYFEKFLMLNGYSTSGSLRAFDNIIETAFKCGYSQTYTGMVIADNNVERENKYLPEEYNKTDTNLYRQHDIYLIPELVKKYERENQD